VTGGIVRLDAQWALHGKRRGREGYRVLASSTGDLSPRNFEEAIGRFQLGTLDTLPQVSVSYLTPASGPGGSYVGLASHEFAADGRRDTHDENGARITYTSYFCVPYAPLAEAAISYQDLHEALRAIRMPTANGPPVPLAIAVPAWRTPAVDPLAMRVAALLLTGQRVCVLGAEATSVAGRLRFIDMVMTLLPYGMRAKMTAATWTKATNRDHRFRLFFSSASRITQPPDQVVHWGHPERTVMTHADGPAFEYLAWLEETVSRPIARMSGLTEPVGFSRDQLLRTLEDIGVTDVTGVAGREPAEAKATAGQDLTHFLAAPQRGSDFAEGLLLRLARHIATGNPEHVRPDLQALRKYAADHAPDAESQARYREIIREGRLLGPHESLDRLDGKVYAALLPLAFEIPLSLDGYCQLEDCLEIQPGDPPHQALLRAVVRAGMSDPLPAAIVRWHLRTSDDGKLTAWLASGQVDAGDLIDLLANEWQRPQHARIVCDLTLDYLQKATSRYEPHQVLGALRRHGFLAGALSKRHPGTDQYQVSALYQFLRAAYPGGIGRTDIFQILTGGPYPPTPALLGAVVLHLLRPADWRLAREAYAFGSLTLMSVDPVTASRLRDRAPVIDAVTARDSVYPSSADKPSAAEGTAAADSPE